MALQVLSIIYLTLIHRKLIELKNAFLKARMLEYVVLGSEGNRPATSLYPDSKPGRRVDKRVFYHCAV